MSMLERTPTLDVALTGMTNVLAGILVSTALISLLPMCFGVLIGLLLMFVLYYSPSRISRRRIALACVSVWMFFFAVIIVLYQMPRVT